MKITLDRTLIKEQIVPLSICFLVLTFILITGRLLQLTRYLFTSSITILDLIELMALAMPKLILYALPMATLLGVLLAFVRLNGDNELVALRAAGISFFQLLPSVLAVLCLTTFLAFVNAIAIVPAANHGFGVKLKSLGRATLPVLLQEGTFIDAIPKLVFFFQSVNTRDLSIDGIFVQDQRHPEVRVAIVAEHAQIITSRDLNHLTFKMSNGVITRVSDNLKDAQTVAFKVYDLNLSLDELMADSSSSTKGLKDRREMTLGELRETLRKAKGNLDVRYALELQQRLALPSACLLLGLMGPPLGALFRQRNRMTGITLGLAVFLTYYVMLSAGMGFGKNSLIPPGAAIWIPNGCCLVAAAYLWTKVQRETPFKLAALLKKKQ